MTRACHEWRGELAARALGAQSPETDAALDAHLDGCADCHAELAELRATAGALSLADPDRSGVPDPGPALADQIVARIALERATIARQRRRRLARASAAAAAAAVAVSIAIGAMVTSEGGEPDVIELAGSGGSTGSARLVARPWGTEVTLDVAGLDDGETYWLWLTDSSGQRVGAGTLTGTEEAAHAILASALPTSETRRIWMTDEEDRVILDAVVDAESLPGR